MASLAELVYFPGAVGGDFHIDTHTHKQADRQAGRGERKTRHEPSRGNAARGIFLDDIDTSSWKYDQAGQRESRLAGGSWPDGQR